jgi:site-specific DNA-methyltransferase (adenine-specific)
MKELEYIIFCRKWKAKAINNCWDWTVLEHNNPRNKTHETEKPVSLLEQLILNSSNENNIILDPFMWSWSCGVASVNTNREFIWIELDEWYFKIAQERILNL